MPTQLPLRSKAKSTTNLNKLATSANIFANDFEKFHRSNIFKKKKKREEVDISPVFTQLEISPTEEYFQTKKVIKAVWLGKGFDNYVTGVQAGVEDALKGSGIKCQISKAVWNNQTGKIDPSSIKGANVLLPSIGGCGTDVLEATKDTLKLVFQPATGYDGIDLKACKQRSIPVCYCPGSNSLQTAETTILLLLAALRRLPALVQGINNRQVGTPTGSDLTGKTACLVGFGNIGKKVGSMLTNAFDCKILPVDSRTPEHIFHEYLSTADIVSVHCPLTPDTESLISFKEISLMKENAVLVNTARGKVVDKEAVIQALKNEKIGFYASDVFWSEPADPNDPIFKLNNVFFTPHVGASTGEHFRHLGRLLCDAIEKVFVSDTPEALADRLA